MAHGQKTTEYVLYPITTRRSSSLSNLKPIKTTNTGMENEPNIPTQNRFSIFAECLLHDTDHTNTTKENNELHVHPENSPASHKTSTNLLSWTVMWLDEGRGKCRATCPYMSKRIVIPGSLWMMQSWFAKVPYATTQAEGGRWRKNGTLANNRFDAKYVNEKLKVMFQKIADFNDLPRKKEVPLTKHYNTQILTKQTNYLPRHFVYSQKQTN
ncbi:hypothetical protein K0M31_007100 [Melipona bicolor]|uniref:Uncharacterized protein n=1 Tax=Melipona bicolor TaxID=60889 RepID=A0AA40KKX6_9HYME|nr:hypothetical protein K0M31_007100 [Melipona bicolor]